MIPEKDKLTWKQVNEIIYKYHKDNNIHYTSNRDNFPVLRFRIVFDSFASKWKKYETKWDYSGDKPVRVYDLSKPRTYTEESCTYEFTDTEKYWFVDNIISRSLYAFCLNKDEPDSQGIRLDNYIDVWKILYCYQVK